jgi:hypothetical protein
MTHSVRGRITNRAFYMTGWSEREALVGAALRGRDRIASASISELPRQQHSTFRGPTHRGRIEAIDFADEYPHDGIRDICRVR